jgi:DNA integrity scanning protein DisA with diadenylate cyclase activity
VAPVAQVPAKVETVTDWRKSAIELAERLKYAEAQCGDLRKAADEARARFTKYKTRLDHAQERINVLQVEKVAAAADAEATIAALRAENDELRARLTTQDELKQGLMDLYIRL